MSLWSHVLRFHMNPKLLTVGGVWPMTRSIWCVWVFSIIGWSIHYVHTKELWILYRENFGSFDPSRTTSKKTLIYYIPNTKYKKKKKIIIVPTNELMYHQSPTTTKFKKVHPYMNTRVYKYNRGQYCFFTSVCHTGCGIKKFFK